MPEHQKRIIIIGASSGMGKRMAELYAEKGHRIGITATQPKLLEQIQHQFPQQVEYEAFDVREPGNIEHLRSLIDKLGGMDILVISAGTGEPSDELKWEIDKRIVDTNVNGFVEIANWSYNYFVQQGSGQLAAISSVAANRGSSYSPAYSASKAFMSVYLEGLSIKARKQKRNIAITCIEPGFVKTAMAHGGTKMFWIVPVDKAARQIIRGIQKKKRKVYISRRWWLIVKIMRWAPFWLYRRFG